jgi:hypothetical protein
MSAAAERAVFDAVSTPTCGARRASPLGCSDGFRLPALPFVGVQHLAFLAAVQLPVACGPFVAVRATRRAHSRLLLLELLAYALQDPCVDVSRQCGDVIAFRRRQIAHEALASTVVVDELVRLPVGVRATRHIAGAHHDVGDNIERTPELSTHAPSSECTVL